MKTKENTPANVTAMTNTIVKVITKLFSMDDRDKSLAELHRFAKSEIIMDVDVEKEVTALDPDWDIASLRDEGLWRIQEQVVFMAVYDTTVQSLSERNESPPSDDVMQVG